VIATLVGLLLVPIGALLAFQAFQAARTPERVAGRQPGTLRRLDW
jgi:hypothetical protein